MDMKNIVGIINVNVLVIAVDLCRASPTKCADRDTHIHTHKNDWHYKFPGPSTAERSHLQRRRKDRRAVAVHLSMCFVN